ncbi:hypothetical protein, partial [Natrialba taiwanensis]|uniref:hypothetical protein n=1 Tax=Natrialba taiwanensis TaxID=160846 RepID=UPI001955220F
ESSAQRRLFRFTSIVLTTYPDAVRGFNRTVVFKKEVVYRRRCLNTVPSEGNGQNATGKIEFEEPQ